MKLLFYLFIFSLTGAGMASAQTEVELQMKPVPIKSVESLNIAQNTKDGGYDIVLNKVIITQTDGKNLDLGNVLIPRVADNLNSAKIRTHYVLKNFNSDYKDGLIDQLSVSGLSLQYWKDNSSEKYKYSGKVIYTIKGKITYSKVNAFDNNQDQEYDQPTTVYFGRSIGDSRLYGEKGLAFDCKILKDSRVFYQSIIQSFDYSSFDRYYFNFSQDFGDATLVTVSFSCFKTGGSCEGNVWKGEDKLYSWKDLSVFSLVAAPTIPLGDKKVDVIINCSKVE